MPTPVIMPKFGMAQEEGTIIRWLKNEGDLVEKGEELLEVQTDKVDMEVESPASGILADIRFGVDITVPVTTVIAQIFAVDEKIVASPPVSHVVPTSSTIGVVSTTDTATAAPKATPLAQRMAVEKGLDLAQVAGSGPSGRIVRADVESVLQSQSTAAAGTVQMGKPRATPAARRLARESALELSTVSGSGPLGRIQSADVAACLAQIAVTEAQVASDVPTMSEAQLPLSTTQTAIPLKGMRKTIATRLTQSWQQIPMVTFTTSAELTEMDALRKKLGPEVETTTQFKLSLTVLIARAVATALRRHPRLNATLTGQHGDWLLTEYGEVNLGIAVALDDGLIVPVVERAELLGLCDLAAKVGDLSQRARARQLLPDETAGGTFTISNLGMFAVEHFTALINPPQVAILAVGQAQVKPLWDGQSFQPRLVVELTLSADHRAVDGAVAAAFLSELKRLIEEPARLLL